MFYWLLTGVGGVLAMLELGANQHLSIVHNREEKMNPIRELTASEIGHVSGGPAPVVVVVVVAAPAVSKGAAAIGAAVITGAAIIAAAVITSSSDDSSDESSEECADETAGQ